LNSLPVERDDDNVSQVQIVETRSTD